MNESFTTTQKKRLTELNAGPETLERTFPDADARNRAFKELETGLVREGKKKLTLLLNETRLPRILRIEEDLSRWLASEGFTRVTTPAIITAEMLDRMSIGSGHPLREQVFWLDATHCLRPMLAPNLYQIMGSLHDQGTRPVRIFEIGSCFRKESQGARHMNEFTMLNLVELDGVEEGGQMARLEELARGAMEAVGIRDYAIEKEKSEVYLETLDIVAGELELASGAYGPHPLDGNWGIFAPWVGIGLGLERLAMHLGGYQTIKRAGKSLAYLDGVPLKL